MNDQIILAESFSRLQYYASHYQLAPLRIGYSKHRRFTNRRMLVNHRLDLTGVDIFAARDDHVLGPIQDIEISVCIAITDISRAKHAVSERAPTPGWPRTLAIVQDAAFHLYQRGAVDYAP